MNQPTLSRTQRAIVQRMVRGERMKEIARAIGRSPRTVEMHMDLARTATGTVNAAHLAAVAVSRGLVDPPAFPAPVIGDQTGEQK